MTTVNDHRFELRDFARKQQVQPYILALIEKNLVHAKDQLSTYESQKRYILTQHIQYRECPYCDQDVSYFEAIRDADYRLGHGAKELHCIHCKEEIVDVVPFISAQGWYWGKKKKAEKIARPGL